MGPVMNKKVLVVEDHKPTCSVITAVLLQAGLEPVCVGTASEARKYLKSEKPCLIVLDIRLPDQNGLSVCRWVRRSEKLADVPIVALTGLTELHDKEMGFEAGVDQYLTKPIIIEEFAMWVKALLRRVEIDTRGGKVVSLGTLQIDVSSQLIKFDGKIVENLTAREFELIYALARSSPRILSRKAILEDVWHTVAVENLVDTHLFNLRAKLPQGLSEKIQAVAGKGFRYFDSEA